MNKKMLTVFGLKWDPFSPDQPTEALFNFPHVNHFCWRVEQLAQQGGFASITGDPGTGKSVTLRLLDDRLSALPDVSVGVIAHPQSSVADFYREMSDLFGIAFTSNRWGGFKALRAKWKSHIEATLFRPVLLIDEAQLCKPAVLSELQLLSSTDFDSRSVLTIVLCGDKRLNDRFRCPELLPLASRLRVKLSMEVTSREDLSKLLRHMIEEAGNSSLMTVPLMNTLAEHAMGNVRALTTMAGELLAAAVKDEVTKLDEKLFFQVFTPLKVAPRAKKPKGRRRQ